MSFIYGVTAGVPAVTKTPYILLITIIYILKTLDTGRASSDRDTPYFANYLHLENPPQAEYDAHLPTSVSPSIAVLRHLI